MRAFWLFLLLLSLLALAWWRGWRPPDRFNPWARLDLREPPDRFIRYKLKRLAEQPVQCRAALRQAGARFTAVPDRHGPGQCGWHDAVRLRGTGVASLAPATVVTCPLAASLVLFDRQVVQPAAQLAFHQPVKRIDDVGSYACRNIYRRADAPLSRHARAQAIDVDGFDLVDGRRVGIGAGWHNGHAREQFLHACARWRLPGQRHAAGPGLQRPASPPLPHADSRLGILPLTPEARRDR